MHFYQRKKVIFLRSDAQKRAEKKYKEKTYKTFSVNARTSDYEKIDAFCAENNISKSQLLLKSALYCIDRKINLD